MPSSCRVWASFSGSASRRSEIIVRNASIPASVNNSRGSKPVVSNRSKPRFISPFAVGDTFGFPTSAPPRQVFS
jgi:hypothetical protein